MTPYATQPGTIAHRALQFLRQHQPREFSTAELADALGADQSGFASYLGPAKYHGLVKTRRIVGKGKVLWWSLGDGRPEPRPDDEEAEQPLKREPAQVIVRPGELLPGVRGGRPDESRLAAYVALIGTDARPDTEALPFNACRYIDGSLIVVGVSVREDGAIIFTPEQAAQLWRLGSAA